MCGRFNVIDNPELQQLLRDLGIDLNLPTRTNIAPTEPVAMVRLADGGNELAEVRWWLTPRWAKQVDQKYAMFNARSETLASSRAFSEPFKRHRGIVPVSSFIEWRSEAGGKQPYLIEAVDQALALAAVWDCWGEGDDRVESCALVTTAAATDFQRLHNRMPVMLRADERERWLNVSKPLEADDPLFSPVLKQPLRIQPVSRGVNSARNKDPQLVESIGEGFELAVGSL
jgi:putative SOS response-associated peptidase YedK